MKCDLAQDPAPPMPIESRGRHGRLRRRVAAPPSGGNARSWQPGELMSNKRRQYRTRPSSALELEVAVLKPGLEPAVAQVVDLSVGGAALSFSGGKDPLYPLREVVNL